MDKEPSEEPSGNWIKRNLRRAVSRLRRHGHSRPPEEQAPQQIAETPQEMSREDVAMVFARVEDLLKGADPSKISENFKLPTPGGGAVEAKAMGELISAQESLELSKSGVGDVVWWRDKDGGSAFYLITESYADKGEGHQYKHGKGVISGEMLGEKIDKVPAVIEGAGFGIMKMGAVSKNLPVNFIVPEKGESYGWWKTPPVQSFGIIKSEKIRGNNPNTPTQKR